MEQDRYDYSPIIGRPPLRWPDGAHVALWVIPNIEHFHFDAGGGTTSQGTPVPPPDVRNYSWRDYGARVGVWRIMEVLDKHQIRATVALNGDVCQHYPQIMQEGMKRQWEWMGHGMSNSWPLSGLPPEEERAVIKATVEAIEKATGQRPRGWLGPGLGETYSTPDLLAEAGVEYVCDWVNDDQPYLMRVKGGSIVSIPYSIEVNDIPIFVAAHHTGQEFCDIVTDRFDQLYKEGAESGRVIAIALHPYLIGQAHRIKYLDRALAYIRRHERVWYATGSEIVDSFVQQAGGRS